VVLHTDHRHKLIYSAALSYSRPPPLTPTHSDMLSSQLRGRELDLSEAQRTAAAAAAEVAALRSQLAAARQAAAAEAAAMETQLAAKEAEVGGGGAGGIGRGVGGK